MIRRLYVDNFRSLVDFTWEPGKETLVLGYNGSGKTSALEVIDIIRTLGIGTKRLDEVVQWTDTTLWKRSDIVRFELDMELKDQTYRYEVIIGPGLIGSHFPVFLSEKVILDGRELFHRQESRVQMMAEDGAGPLFPIDEKQSVVSVIGPDLGGEDVVSFRNHLGRLLYLKPSPVNLFAHKRGLAKSPDPSLSDLVPWYLHLAKEESFVTEFRDAISAVWPEVTEILTPEYSPDVFDFVLRTRLTADSEEFTDIPLGSLSDGERLLIGLYVVATFQRTHPATTIIIDEPDNYVSLLELQPWLLMMLDDRPENGQLILISHNPEIINLMGTGRTVWFDRENHRSPTRAGLLEPDESGLSLTERIARGWIHA